MGKSAKSPHKIDPLQMGQKVPILTFLSRSRRVVSGQKKIHEKFRKIKKYQEKWSIFPKQPPLKKHEHMIVFLEGEFGQENRHFSDIS